MVARYLQDYADQPTTDEIRTLLQETASVNKTDASLFNTLDLLVYASCDPENAIVDISEWKSTVSPPLTTATTITTTQATTTATPTTATTSTIMTQSQATKPTHNISNGSGSSAGVKVIVFIISFAVVFFPIVGFACLFIYMHYRCCKH